jgi:hypothetical protein
VDWIVVRGLPFSLLDIGAPLRSDVDQQIHALAMHPALRVDQFADDVRSLMAGELMQGIDNF